jgi:DNA replication protein DnaC
VEALKLMFAQRRTMRPRFKFPISEEELCLYIQAAIMEEVESRHRTFELSNSFQERIRKMAQWLANDNAKNGMMLCGTCGNGKTTFIKAVQRLFNLFRLPDSYNNSTFGIKLITAKDIVNLYKSNFKSWKDLAKSPMIAIDDLGCEPTELLDFGNVSNPVIDLLSIRYDEQLTTLISTNLTPAEIRAKYGDRIADRLNEMMERIHFDNATFRTDTYKNK